MNLSTQINDLVNQYSLKQSSAESYREAVKSISKETKIRSSVLNKHVAAIAKGEEGSLREEIEQAQELLGV